MYVLFLVLLNIFIPFSATLADKKWEPLRRDIDYLHMIEKREAEKIAVNPENQSEGEVDDDGNSIDQTDGNDDADTNDGDGLEREENDGEDNKEPIRDEL